MNNLNDKMTLSTPDGAERNTALLTEWVAQTFPNCITEGKVDFDLLRQECSSEIIDGAKERYRLEWSGKREAIVTANLPSNKTLRPIREDSKDFDTTENLYIEGDNLEVLKLMQESYLNQIKMIYIDPPYNTGNEFIYNDKYSIEERESLIEQGIKNEEGVILVKEKDKNGQDKPRYHSDWLTFMYPRLKLARNLLTDDGVIFISIDDNEVDNLQKISNEIFGENNFIARIIHKNNSMKNQSKYIGITTEYVLLYSKNIDYLKQVESEWRIRKRGTADVKKMYASLKQKGMSIEEIREEILSMYSRPKYSHLGRWNKVDDIGVFTDKDLSRANGYKNFTIINPETGKPCLIPSRGWGKSKEDLVKLQEENMIWYGDDNTPPREKSYLSDDADSVFDNYIYIDTSIDKKMIDEMFGAQVFEYPKPIEMINTFLQLCSTKQSIILDFFSGSSTTAHAVMQLNAEDGGNRKFIMVQLPEATDEKSEAYKAGYKNICEIGKERIRRAGKAIKDANPLTTQDLDTGFKVLRLDDSNIKNVMRKPGELTQGELNFNGSNNVVENLRDGRSDEDLIYQVLITWGLPLTLPIVKTEMCGKTVYKVDGNALYCCFEDGVTRVLAEALAHEKPMRVLFADRSFKDDNEKENVKQTLRQISPETEMRVL